MSFDVAVKLAPFNPTSSDAIAEVLAVVSTIPAASHESSAGSELSRRTFVDIGCGDGKVCIAVARSCPGWRIFGIDTDENLYKRAELNKSAEDAEVQRRIEFVCGDASKVDLPEEATVVFAYLVPDGLRIMLPYFDRVLANGGSLMTNMFSIREWEDHPAILHEKRMVRHGLSVHFYTRKA